MSEEAQQLEFENNNLYRDRYQRTLGWLLTMAIACVVLVVTLTYMSVNGKQSDYYATTTKGAVIPLHPLSEPVITNQYLVQWASLATRKAFNLDDVHYQAQLKRAEPYFTPTGWKKFLSALNSSGLLGAVKSKKLMMSTVVSGPPVILNRAVVHGRFTWRIQLPLLVTFTSASEKTKSKLMVTMNVQRVPVLSAAKGIAISDFSARGMP